MAGADLLLYVLASTGYVANTVPHGRLPRLVRRVLVPKPSSVTGAGRVAALAIAVGGAGFSQLVPVGVVVTQFGQLGILNLAILAAEISLAAAWTIYLRETTRRHKEQPGA